jgi:hypothetical protein
MKNEYEIVDNQVFIILKDRCGIIRKCIVDIDDFDKVNQYAGTLFASYRKRINGYYACMTLYLGIINGKAKYQTMYLHRIIMDVKERNIRIDHKDYNTLNNSKDNLRISSPETNSTHRSRPNRNNKTGYRNVCEINNQFVVQLQIDGKNKVLGKFDIENLEDAVEFAEVMRQKYYGEFAGI